MGFACEIIGKEISGALGILKLKVIAGVSF
jgi:hypothetical protein